MRETRQRDAQAAFSAAVLDQMPIAVTVIASDARLLYYNECASRLLDRKPEYIGRDIRTLHKPESAAKIDLMIEAFRGGRREEFYFEVTRGESTLGVTVAPLIKDGSFTACIHCVRPVAGPAAHG